MGCWKNTFKHQIENSAFKSRSGVVLNEKYFGIAADDIIIQKL